MSAITAAANQGLDQYMTEIRRFSLLTREEEHAFALRLRDDADVEAAHALVTSNLRFVVKVAMEYRKYGARTLDLVQEGNVGLMHAVRKFDPDRGYRLITYAVWWIRAYIQSYLLRAFSLVKIGTTQAQRRIFFRLGAAKNRLEQSLGPDLADLSDQERHAELARVLGVRPKDVSEMEMRLSARDFSLDLTLEEGGDATHLDVLPDDDSASSESLVALAEMRAGIATDLAEALKELTPREREIMELRHLTETPPTLREIGERWGVSRERARQIEAQAREKMKRRLLAQSEVLKDMLPEAVRAARPSRMEAMA
jgi:RNA polymerase sigma-32 factor